MIFTNFTQESNPKEIGIQKYRYAVIIFKDAVFCGNARAFWIIIMLPANKATQVTRLSTSRIRFTLRTAFGYLKEMIAIFSSFLSRAAAYSESRMIHT